MFVGIADHEGRKTELPIAIFLFIYLLFFFYEIAYFFCCFFFFFFFYLTI